MQSQASVKPDALHIDNQFLLSTTCLTVHLLSVKRINSGWPWTELQSNFMNVAGSDTLFIFLCFPSQVL
jgi:hypothetical protein